MSFSFVPYGKKVLSAIVVNIFKCFLSKWSSAIKMHCKYCFVFACKPSLLTKGCADKRYTVVHHLGYKVCHQAQHQARLGNKVLHKKIYSLWCHLKCTTKKTRNANKGFKVDAGWLELYWQLLVEHCYCYVWTMRMNLSCQYIWWIITSHLLIFIWHWFSAIF